MFVAINNTDMNVFKVDEWINHTRDANGGVISPEFVMEILSKTNFHGHIKKVLKNIKENCTTKEELMPYKEFILSCIDGRDMSDTAFKDLREMAEKCGFADDFYMTCYANMLYDKNDCEGVTITSKEELKKLDGENLKVYFDTNGLAVLDIVHIDNNDLHNVKVLKFRENSKVCINEANLENLDVSKCFQVTLCRCDLSKGRKLRFGVGSRVNLDNVKNIPEDLDVSMCNEVRMQGCDVGKVKNLNFRNRAAVYLFSVENLPDDLDISMCSTVVFNSFDIDSLKLNFRDDAKVQFLNIVKYPENLDISMCSDIEWHLCDLNMFKNLKFKDGANVNFDYVINFPEALDLSMCSKVYAEYCDLSGVKELKFKDKEQEKRFMEGAKNFEGKVVYASGKQNIPAMVNLGKEM